MSGRLFSAHRSETPQGGIFPYCGVYFIRKYSQIFEISPYNSTHKVVYCNQKSKSVDFYSIYKEKYQMLSFPYM